MTITKEESEEKTKNPKRVEQGKKLAKISREAKERKRTERQEEKRKAESFLPNLYLLTTVTVIGAAAGVVGTYIAWGEIKPSVINIYKYTGLSWSKTEKHSEPKPTSSKITYNNLDEDDI